MNLEAFSNLYDSMMKWSSPCELHRRTEETSTADLQGQRLSSTRLFMPTVMTTSRAVRREAWKLTGKVHREKETYKRWMQGGTQKYS